MNHTPGPWTVAPSELFSDRRPRILNRKQQAIAIVCLTGNNETEGNAQVLAAAPMLIDAAQRALQLIKDTWIEDHGSEQVGLAWEALDKALRAAGSLSGEC